MTTPFVEQQARDTEKRSSPTLPTPFPARKVRVWLLLAGGAVIVLAVAIVLLLVFLR